LAGKLFGENTGPFGGNFEDSGLVLNLVMVPTLEQIQLCTYHVADIGTLDQQTADQVSIFFSFLCIPALDSAHVVGDFLLQFAEIGHVLKMQAHICGKYAGNHQPSHGSVLECRSPVSAQYL
jgi:hypothetical protein